MSKMVIEVKPADKDQLGCEGALVTITTEETIEKDELDEKPSPHPKWKGKWFGCSLYIVLLVFAIYMTVVVTQHAVMKQCENELCSRPKHQLPYEIKENDPIYGIKLEVYLVQPRNAKKDVWDTLAEKVEKCVEVSGKNHDVNVNATCLKDKIGKRMKSMVGGNKKGPRKDGVVQNGAKKGGTKKEE